MGIYEILVVSLLFGTPLLVVAGVILVICKATQLRAQQQESDSLQSMPQQPRDTGGVAPIAGLNVPPPLPPISGESHASHVGDSERGTSIGI